MHTPGLKYAGIESPGSGQFNFSRFFFRKWENSFHFAIFPVFAEARDMGGNSLYLFCFHIIMDLLKKLPAHSKGGKYIA